MEIVPMLILLVALLAREWSYRAERAENAKQTQALLQRIQAPTLAIQSYATEDVADRPSVAVPLFDDEDYNKLYDKVLND